MDNPPEVWLRGPIPGIDPLLVPVAHALLQAREDVHALENDVRPGDVWKRPGGAASIGFHLHHLAGSLDRLLTYARGEMLTADQKAALKAETALGESGPPLGEIVNLVSAAVDRALAQVRETSRERLLEAREVGRARLPSTVVGLMFHAAEHTTRHVGQAITTARILSAAGGW
jgi:uncharacterized damage-inducible protein DinB